MVSSYKELTINQYLGLKDLMADEVADDLGAQARLVAYLDNKTEDEVLNLPLADYHRLVQKTNFLMTLPEPSKKAPAAIKVGNYKLKAVTEVAQMTTAQYIDFENLLGMPEREKYLASIVACFYIPVGKKYNQGYDLDEVTKLIGDNVSVQDAMDVCFFFQKRYLSSIEDSLRYLEFKTRRMMRKEKDETTKTSLKEAVTKIRQYRDLLSAGIS
jgi:hypothetical protein